MPSDQPFRLGTRGSQLALCQARMVAGLLAQSGHAFEIVVIKTSGDRLQERPLSEDGGKSLFVKELEESLLGGEIDLAVHSSKDMPAVLPEGLSIAGVLPREDPRDAVVLPVSATRRRLSTLEELVSALGQTPVIGTGSVRRVAQLTRLFPSARFVPIRGNLDTRVRKLDAGEHHALVLAAAGLRRLGFESRITFTLPTQVCLPAPGQGIVAVETRSSDARLRRAMSSVSDGDARAALEAERSLVEALGGGCQTPIGGLATPVDNGELELAAAVISLDGSRAVRTVARGPRDQPAAVGELAARQLIAEGAGEILDEARRTGRGGTRAG